MRTLNFFVIKSLLIIFTATIVILTFAMLGGNVLQVLKFLASGIPIGDFVMAMLYFLPMILSFTVPSSILVAVLLLFGRMSSNNEITAMRASGISVFQIISPLIVVTFIMTVICLYLQVQAGPYCIGKGRDILYNTAITAPQALISPGQATDFGNMVVYVKDKKGSNLKDVQIFSFDDSRQKVNQDITSATGKLEADKDKGTLKIILYDYYIIDYQKNDRIYGKTFTVTLDVAKNFNNQPLIKREDFMTLSELLGIISLYHKLGLSTLVYEIQLNLRFAMGLAPIAFLLLGLPLAIRTSRGETSVGLFISVMLAGAYFFFIIGCRTMDTSPQLYPQYLLWIPNIVYQIGGLFFIFRLTRK
jgi:lipopolysaccharide export system permease protein